ncbi:MAG: hypothetical protein WD847_05010 [Pirellulales bacterium]
MEEVKKGQIRTVWHDGKPRSVEIICSSHLSPGYWMVQDTESASTFMLPTELLVTGEIDDRPRPAEEGPASDEPADPDTP